MAAKWAAVADAEAAAAEKAATNLHHSFVEGRRREKERQFWSCEKWKWRITESNTVLGEREIDSVPYGGSEFRIGTWAVGRGGRCR